MKVHVGFTDRRTVDGRRILGTPTLRSPQVPIFGPDPTWSAPPLAFATDVTVDADGAIRTSVQLEAGAAGRTVADILAVSYLSMNVTATVRSHEDGVDFIDPVIVAFTILPGHMWPWREGSQDATVG